MPTPYLFLDRDGTIICEQHYLGDPSKVVLESGVVEGLQRFIHSGYRLSVVSNQSGVGRGLITEVEVAAVNSQVAELLSSKRIVVSSWHHCPHTPQDNCSCRKPKPALFEAAAALHPVDWINSIMVGDKPSDVLAGLSLGMKAVLVTTGHGLCHIDWAITQDVPVVRSLLELADFILPN